MSRTHRQIIALWDNIEAFAADVGVKVVAARKWTQQRRRIPPAHFGAVLKTKKARDNKVTLTELDAGADMPAPDDAADDAQSGEAAA